MGASPISGIKDQVALMQKQDADAARLKLDMLQQPKKVAPDDFMARKNKSLNALRMGMASTMTGAGGSLATQPGALKTKMGA